MTKMEIVSKIDMMIYELQIIQQELMEMKE